MKNPPVLIAVLGFFAALAGFGYLFFGLRVIGFDWFGVLGDLPAFERVGLWGWLAVMTGIVWLLAAFGLWALQPWARLFALVIAGFALFEAVLAFLQFPGSGIGIGMAILPILILWYLNSAEVKAAFGDVAPAAAGAGAVAAGAVPPAPVSAPAPSVAAAPVAAPAAAVASVAVAAPVAASAAATPAALESVAAPAAAAGDTAAAGETVEPPAANRRKIEEVEGIGPVHGAKLAEIGIHTTDDLLTAGAKPYGREKIAAETGISSKLIREWVDNADLMRVPGVGSQYSDLLEAAGVGSPAELAQRNPANLEDAIQSVVAERPGVVRRIPSQAEIAGWIEAAGELEQVVEH